MSETATPETMGFQTEVRQLLQLMIHSLYSNKEIFLRELISNASDAADKLRFESLENAELLEDQPELAIRVEFDAKKGVLTVVDNGIGMSRDELIDNLGTIAKSGTSEFLQQMTGDEKQDTQLIGQFGVGFYSAFIVADKVVVESRRAGLQASEGVRWESAGEGEFTVSPLDKSDRGTTVSLHLKDSESEFADSYRLEALIKKYSDHIGFPVMLLDRAEADAEAKNVNSATALWTRPRADVTGDEYKEFYKHLSHDFADPMSWSHNRVEGKREYTSLLYIPANAPFDLWNRDVPRGLKLYVQRVFIMDDAEQFLPLYLRFVKGVVDSSDLPLNVSRELLQRNSDLDAMRGALTRRVLDMLHKLASGDEYQKFWDQFGQVLKEGFVEDSSNAEKLAKLMRFSTTQGDSGAQDQSLAAYVSRAADDQDKIYYLLADSYAAAKSSPHLEQLHQRNIEVILMYDHIDAWMMEHLKEFDGKELLDVSRGQLSLPDADGEITQSAMNDENKPLLKKMHRTLNERVEAVNVSQRLVDSAACVVAAEQDLTPQLRKMLEAAGQDIPASKPILEINIEHPLVKRLSGETEDQRFEALSNIIMDHALLAEGTALADPASYVQRMNNLLLEIDAS